MENLDLGTMMKERKYNCYLTADTILIVDREVLLVRRKNEPFRGMWCIPGGFVDPEEKVHDGAQRELMEETGVVNQPTAYFGAYSDPGRDPRGRTVTFVFWARLASKPDSVAGDDAAECQWFSLDNLPPMAFDHRKILTDFRQRLPKLEQEKS